jgi:N-acetylglucosaminyldiphosphoundecaprenol N-acetyl-beta-D-mannosaminyltransferase
VKTEKSLLPNLNFEENSWKMWGVPLYSKGTSEVLKVVENWLDSKQTHHWIATVNPEFVMMTTKEKEFLNILKRTDLNIVDGIGLVWAKKIIKEKSILRKISIGFKIGIKIMQGEFRNELASGSDLMEDMCKLAALKGYSVYFLGGWNNRAERTASYFMNKYPKLKVAGFYSGRPIGDDMEIEKRLGDKRIDILLVAFGMKKQEEWIARNLKKFNVGVAMGVGRSFDYYSGDLKRAPKFLRKMGFEWFYSLIKEPKRFKRQLSLPVFIWKVLTD